MSVSMRKRQVLRIDSNIIALKNEILCYEIIIIYFSLFLSIFRLSVYFYEFIVSKLFINFKNAT